VFQKPSGLVPHGGGLRLPAGSYERRLLSRWLKEGMHAPDNKVTLADLKVIPEDRLFSRPGESQQILAIARYSDGTSRDVTDMARYSVTDDSVASATDTGLVTGKGAGEASVVVAYGGLVKAAHFLTPVGKTPVLRQELPASNAIDD